MFNCQNLVAIESKDTPQKTGGEEIHIRKINKLNKARVCLPATFQLDEQVVESQASYD